MFVDTNEVVNIVIYYKKVKQNYVAYGEKDFEDLKLKDEEKSKFKVTTIKMKPLTWGLFNELQESAITRGINGERLWNYKLYKENRLKSLIVGWDAKKTNAKGEVEAVPVNNENILNLAPDVAEAILNAYDSVSVLNEEDEKK